MPPGMIHGIVPTGVPPCLIADHDGRRRTGAANDPAWPKPMPGTRMLALPPLTVTKSPLLPVKSLRTVAVGEGAIEVLGDVVAGIVEGEDHEAVAGVESVGVRIFIALEGEEPPSRQRLTSDQAKPWLIQTRLGMAPLPLAEGVGIVAGNHQVLFLLGSEGLGSAL